MTVQQNVRDVKATPVFAGKFWMTREDGRMARRTSSQQAENADPSP
jgi:hypothetical protein